MDINDFPQKVLVWDKWAILDPEWRILTNLDLICLMNESGQERYGNYVNGFSEKNMKI